MVWDILLRNPIPKKEPVQEKLRGLGLPPLTRCAADRDGECDDPQCPQARDGEPFNTGRHCPLDIDDEDE